MYRLEIAYTYTRKEIRYMATNYILSGEESVKQILKKGNNKLYGIDKSEIEKLKAQISNLNEQITSVYDAFQTDKFQKEKEIATLNDTQYLNCVHTTKEIQQIFQNKDGAYQNIFQVAGYADTYTRTTMPINAEIEENLLVSHATLNLFMYNKSNDYDIKVLTNYDGCPIYCYIKGAIFDITYTRPDGTEERIKVTSERYVNKSSFYPSKLTKTDTQIYDYDSLGIVKFIPYVFTGNLLYVGFEFIFNHVKFYTNPNNIFELNFTPVHAIGFHQGLTKFS